MTPREEIALLEQFAATYRDATHGLFMSASDAKLMAAEIDAILALKSSQPIALAGEEGWLIEETAGYGNHWITLAEKQWPRTQITVRHSRRSADFDIESERYKSPVVRVKDASKAIRFARKEDAESFIAMFDKFLLCPVATEHQWPALATPKPAPESPTLRSACEHAFEFLGGVDDAWEIRDVLLDAMMAADKPAKPAVDGLKAAADFVKEWAAKSWPTNTDGEAESIIAGILALKPTPAVEALREALEEAGKALDMIVFQAKHLDVSPVATIIRQSAATASENIQRTLRAALTPAAGGEGK